MAEAPSIQVEVIYATLDSQVLRQVVVNAGADIKTCVLLSGVMEDHPELTIEAMTVGIFSQVKPLDHVVRDGDRIEVYRALIADPKEVRRRKAEATKVKKKP